MLQEIILSLIVSFDIFLSAAAYRSGSIRIPVISGLIISSICAASLGLSLMLSDLISRFVSSETCSIFGLLILMAIGISTIFKSLIRTLVRRLSERGELSLKNDSSGIVIKLYLDDTAADMDRSKVLSPKEAVTLALVGSLDCISVGLSVGYSEIDPLISAAADLIIGIFAIILGSLAGKFISSLKYDLSWLGGAAIIVFAVLEFC